MALTAVRWLALLAVTWLPHASSNVAAASAMQTAKIEVTDAVRETAQRFAGSYVFVGGATEIARRDAAIEDLVSEMNVLLRPIAREKIREGNRIAKRLAIGLDGDSVSVALDGLAHVAALDGSTTQVVGHLGDALDYRIHVTDDRLRQVYSGSRGGSSHRMRARSGNKVAIDVEMTSPRLPKPLRYRLTYGRR